MREILFRGKPIYKEDCMLYENLYKDNKDTIDVFKDGFVYGSLVVIKDKYYICIGVAGVLLNSLVNNATATMIEVVPETVGQFTGLKDKNGKKIFEGDIVKTQPFSDKPYSSKAKYKKHIGVVEYRIRHFKNHFYEQDYEARWIVTIIDYGKFTCYNWNEFFECEIIGNIYDNPELLEVGND